jgi:hypothetical protein
MILQAFLNKIGPAAGQSSQVAGKSARVQQKPLCPVIFLLFVQPPFRARAAIFRARLYEKIDCRQSDPACFGICERLVLDRRDGTGRRNFVLREEPAKRLFVIQDLSLVPRSGAPR